MRKNQVQIMLCVKGKGDIYIPTKALAKEANDLEN